MVFGFVGIEMVFRYRIAEVTSRRKFDLEVGRECSQPLGKINCPLADDVVGENEGCKPLEQRYRRPDNPIYIGVPVGVLVFEHVNV